MSGHRIDKTYRIALGNNPVWLKQYDSGGKTPEGHYVIDGRNPDSTFHLSLHISYPASSDIKRAVAMVRDLSGNIMIHGLANGLGWIGYLHTVYDWTKDCIAVADTEIEEI